MGKYHHWLCACTFNYSLLMKSKKAIPVFIQTEMCIALKTLDVREGWFIPGAHFASLADFVIHMEVVEFILLDILGYTYISLLVWLLRLQICLLFKRGAATCLHVSETRHRQTEISSEALHPSCLYLFHHGVS